MAAAPQSRQTASTVERRLDKLEGDFAELMDVVNARLDPQRDEAKTSHRRALARFEAESPQLANVLRWHAEGISVEEIAALLKRTPGATRELLAQARKKVRAYVPEWQGQSSIGGFGLTKDLAMQPAPTSRRDAPAEPGGGRTGAQTRGEAAKVRWVRDGEVVPAQDVASAWGITAQALGAAAGRGEGFALKVGNKLYYPRVFMELERKAVADVCRALGTLSASEKLVFFTRAHGSLKGQTLVAALESDTTLPRVLELAKNWALERGAAGGVENA